MFKKLVAQLNRQNIFMICTIIGQTRLPLVAEFIVAFEMTLRRHNSIVPVDCVDPLMSLIKKQKSQAVMYCLEDLTILRAI